MQMAGAAQIRAGEAFFEVTVRDNTAKGLRSAQSKMAALGTAVKAVGTGLLSAAAPITAVALALAGGAAALVAGLVKSVSLFMQVSKFAKDAGGAIAGIDPARAERLSAAWNTFKGVLGAIQFVIGSALSEPLTKLLQLAINVSIGFLDMTRNIIDAISGVAAQFGFLNEMSLGFVDGILAALGNGDIPKAFEILTQGIQVIWDGAMFAIQKAMIDTINFVVQTLQSGIMKIAKTINLIGAGIGGPAGKVLHMAAKGIGGAAGVLTPAGQGLTSMIQPGMNQSFSDMMQGGNFLRQLSEAEAARFRRRWAALPDLSQVVGGQLNTLGSSSGTFSGTGASLMGVGSGGGQKVHDDEAHRRLGDILRALKEMDVRPEFK